MENTPMYPMYLIVFAFCYTVTMCIIAYIANLIFKHSQRLPKIVDNGEQQQ